MSTFLYIVRLLTNMHAGSGEANLGIIDNLVQRDVTTGYPCVNSSGVKGALRQHCVQNKMSNEDLKQIFGCSEGGMSFEGKYKFFSLNMVAIPVRSDKNPYYLAVSKSSIEEIINFIKLFFNEKTANDLMKREGIKEIDLMKIEEIQEKDKVVTGDVFSEIQINERIEGLEVVNKTDFTKYVKYIKGLLKTDKKIVLMQNENFAEIVRNLPVIARNHLDDGESKNLWYEQVVPRESIFYTLIVTDGTENKLSDILDYNVQIGANATIGYGITKFSLWKGDICE